MISATSGTFGMSGGAARREMLSYALEDLVEHRFGQPPGLGVVTAAMIAVENDSAIGQRMTRSVRESVIRASQGKRHQHRLVRDRPEREDRGRRRQRFELRAQVAVALAHL